MKLERRSFIKGSAVAGLGLAGSIASAAYADAPIIAEPAKEGDASGWRIAPEPISEDSIVETKEADYIVIGAAHAGGAVLRSIAEDSSHTVIGLEKQAHETFFTMGNDVGHINSQFLRDHGIADVDPVVMYRDWMKRTLGSANPSLIMQFMQNSGTDMDWYLNIFDQDLVSQFVVPYTQQPDSLLSECAGFTYTTGTLRVCTAEHPDINMSLMQQRIYDAILAQENAEIDFETTAVQLIKDGTRVCGVIAQNANGEYVKYIANLGVVLAAGDFGGNAQMREDLLGHITDCFQEGDDWGMIMAQDGSGIKMGVWAGGRMEPRPIACMNGDWGRGNYQAAAIWLDQNGQRYCNEFLGEMPFAGKPLARLPHSIDTWAIADSNLAQNVKTTISAHDAFEASDGNVTALADQLSAAIGTGAAGYIPPRDNSHPGAPMQEGEQLPSIFCADTLEELAAFIGYDETATKNLVASVESWNACCAAGIDSEYGKDEACLFPIDTPPYYAFRQNSGMVGGLMVTLGGLMTDRYQNVLDQNCEPIEGLYATGNCCGQRFGVGYFTQTPGNSLGLAIVLGRELGKYLAAK